MLYRRLRHFEERKQKKRLFMSLVGILGIFALLLIFGLKLLVSFSLFIDKIRGNSPQTQTQTSILLPPTLDPLPNATNSATLTISGTGQAGLTLILYKNENEVKQLPIPSTGTFSISTLSFDEGENTMSAKVKNDKGETDEKWTGNYLFENEWQSFRTKKNPTLEFISILYEYKQSGKYRVMVKVVDILGIDTSKIIEIKI